MFTRLFEKGKNVPPVFKTMSFGILEKRSNKNQGLLKPLELKHQTKDSKSGMVGGCKNWWKGIEKSQKRFDEFERKWFSIENDWWYLEGADFNSKIRIQHR